MKNRGCLVCGAVLVGVFGVWFVRQVGEAREAARRAQCTSHLKWIAFALHNYHSLYGSFPVGTISHPDLAPGRRLGWVAELWDVQGNLTILKIDPMKGWDEPPNWPPKVVAAANVRFNSMEPEATSDWVTCPDDPSYRGPKNPYPLTYVGVAGVGADAPRLPAKHPRAGVFGYDRVTRIEDITDGTNQTMMLVETTRDHGPWTAGGPASVRGIDPATRPYIGRDRPFGGYHPGGVNVAFADGSVRFLRESIDSGVFEALATVAGGEHPPTPWGRSIPSVPVAGASRRTDGP
jgi:prepilin-type processing-associated H-X9-DG protein